MNYSSLVVVFLLIAGVSGGLLIFANDLLEPNGKSLELGNLNSSAGFESAIINFQTNTTNKLTNKNIVSQAIIGIYGFIELIVEIAKSIFGFIYDYMSSVFGLLNVGGAGSGTGIFIGIFIAIFIGLAVFKLISYIVGREL